MRLTENQLAIWAAQKEFPESPLYRITGYMRICGGVDIPVFQRAFQAFIDKTDILRTTFEECDGVPVQRVMHNLELHLECIDFSQDPDPERRFQEFLSLRKEDVFDLSGVLYHSVLIKISPLKYIWYNDLHHLICDGYSMQECLRRMSIIYRRLKSREPLDDLVFTQFQEYRHSAETYTGTERWRRDGEFWAAQAAGAAKQVSFFDRSFTGATTEVQPVERILEAGLWAGVSAVARQLTGHRESSDAGRFLVLATLALVYLQRLTGEREITLGVAFHNRRGTRAKTAIGPFSTVFPLTIHVGAEDTFAGLLHKVAQAVRGGIRHGRAAPVKSVCHAVLNYHKNSMATLRDENGRRMEGFAGLPCKPFWLHSGHDLNPFTIQLMDLEGTGACKLTFDLSTEIFQPDEAERLTGCFITLLKGFVANPRSSLAELPVSPAAERDQLLFGWGAEADGFFEPATIVEAVEKRVATSPDAIALCFSSERISYGELNTRANQLAHRLISHGAGADKPVAICVERSAHFIVGVLAILKTGAAYVPLNPEYSRHCLTAICRDCAADILLLTESTRGRVDGGGLLRIFLDCDQHRTAALPAHNPGVKISPLNAAYRVYTTGTDGCPKGVCIQHRGLASLVQRHGEVFGLQVDDRITQLAGLSCDACTWEIWPTLIAGACLYIAGDKERASPENLHSFLISNRINISFIPTVMIAWLLELDWSQNTTLRFLLTGGDRLSFKVPDSLPFTLVDNYGPTENILASTSGVAVIKPIVVDSKTVANSQPAESDLTNRPPALPRQLRGQARPGAVHLEPREIEAAIETHPAVERALVNDGQGGGEPTVYITLTENHFDEKTDLFQHLQKTCVAQWESVFDRVYSAGDEEGANPRGSNGSHSGPPMDAEQMRIWRDSTCERVRDLNPCNLYEIGCGNGFLMFPLAPTCCEYYATDISAQALRSVERQLPQVDMRCAQVNLVKTPADNTECLERANIDTVVINSVAQYFPGADYLLRVIEQAVENTTVGGHLFIGDVRDLRYIEEFHAARALSGALKQDSGSFDPRQLWRQAQQAAGEEQELLLHPGFFLRLRDTLVRVSDVDILLKQGAAANEVNRYRYDVIVHLDKHPGQLFPLEKWNRPLDLEALTKYLLSEAPGCLLIPAVPNTRVAADGWLTQTLKEAVADHQCDRDARWAVDDIRQQYAAAVPPSVPSPQEFWELGEALGYKVDISNYYSSDKNKFTVLFRRQNLPAAQLPASRFFSLEQGLTPVRPRLAKPIAYANNPLRTALVESVVASVREHCARVLPADMHPAHIVVMDEIPLTASGEPDRAALPELGAGSSNAKSKTPVVPTRLEKTLQLIREEMLEVRELEAEESFIQTRPFG